MHQRDGQQHRKDERQHALGHTVRDIGRRLRLHRSDGRAEIRLAVSMPEPGAILGKPDHMGTCGSRRRPRPGLDEGLQQQDPPRHAIIAGIRL